MKKEVLFPLVVNILRRAGFLVSDRCDIRPRSFDLAARRDEILILLKVLSNIDGLNEETAREMWLLSKYLLGSPLMVGEKSRDKPLEEGVVYFRHGIPTFNVATLYDYFIENIPPLVYAAHGGLYVNIDGRELREARQEKGLSSGSLAAEVGVSRRTIRKYEEEGMDASVEVALKLEEVLNRALALPLEILERKRELPVDEEHPPKGSILYQLAMMGFKVHPTSQAPFNALSCSLKPATTILTGISSYTASMRKRAQLMSSISRITRTDSVIIIRGESKTSNIDETVVVEKKELDQISDSQDFLDLLQERKVSVKAE